MRIQNTRLRRSLFSSGSNRQPFSRKPSTPRKRGLKNFSPSVDTRSAPDNAPNQRRTRSTRERKIGKQFGKHLEKHIGRPGTLFSVKTTSCWNPRFQYDALSLRHFMSHACFAGLNRSNGAEIIPRARTHRSRQTDRAIPDQNEACGRLEIRVLHLQNHVFMEDWARRGRSLALRH